MLLTPTASDNNKWTGSVDNDNAQDSCICWIRECDARGRWVTLSSQRLARTFHGRLV